MALVESSDFENVVFRTETVCLRFWCEIRLRVYTDINGTKTGGGAAQVFFAVNGRREMRTAERESTENTKTHVICVRAPYCNALRSTHRPFHVVRMAVRPVRCAIGENNWREDESPGESFADAVARGVRREKRKKNRSRPGSSGVLPEKSISALIRANSIPRISLRDRRKIRVLDHAETPTSRTANDLTVAFVRFKFLGENPSSATSPIDADARRSFRIPVPWFRFIPGIDRCFCVVLL